MDAITAVRGRLSTLSGRWVDKPNASLHPDHTEPRIFDAIVQPFPYGCAKQVPTRVVANEVGICQRARSSVPDRSRPARHAWCGRRARPIAHRCGTTGEHCVTYATRSTPAGYVRSVPMLKGCTNNRAICEIIQGFVSTVSAFQSAGH